MKTIRLGLTLGDINGIGPEIVLKACRKRWPVDLQLVVIGSKKIIHRQAEHLKLRPILPDWEPSRPNSNSSVCVWDPGANTSTWSPGKITKTAGRASGAWITNAATACLSGQLHGMVTAPINKKAFELAGIRFPGHTEMLAEAAEVERFAMMLMGGPLRVVLVTRHIPLKKVASGLTPGSICDAIEITAEALRWIGLRRQRIAVCGLNPHAGDSGAIGDEEQKIIAPVLKKLKRRGLDLQGPVPADTVFHFAMKGHYDAVVAMYHDQGLAPLKMLAFDQGVNVTLGLPFVRTSPDHGTAMDIAGLGKANPSSMVEAIKAAYGLAKKKNPWRS